ATARPAPAGRRDCRAAALPPPAPRHILGLPEDRRHSRVTPRNTTTRLILPNGSSVMVCVTDISQSGAAIRSEHRPEVASPVTIGDTPARVIRHLDHGFAVEFLRLQHLDFLEENVTTE